MPRLNKTIVDRIEPDPLKQVLVWDEAVKGFGVRVTPTGTKTFILQYRDELRRSRRVTVGRYGAFTVDEARKKAGAILRGVAGGDDPAAERERRRNAPTMADLADRYFKEYAPRKRTETGDRKMWDARLAPTLGAKKVEDVRFGDVDELHRGLKATPYQANRVLALLSKMFSLANRWEMCSGNPCKGVERFQEDRRERFLSQQEIVRLFEALQSVPTDTVERRKKQGRQDNERELRFATTAADSIRLLILTGARRGEVLSATWDQFDLDGGVWTKPSSHTKQKKIHRVPLSAPARQLLETIRERELDKVFVFPGAQEGQPLREIKRFWEKVRATAEIPDVRLHDLRHTFASILASRGASLTMVGALLGHSQPATTARYAHLFDEPLREAAEAVGSFVADAREAEARGQPDGEPTGDVVEISGRTKTA